jgi:hypothetical protein
MSATAAPYGLKPIYDVGGSVKGQVTMVTLGANTATGFFNGDIVNVGVGVATPVAATPTTTRNGNTPWGIFIGANWTDQNGRPQYTQYFPANGYTSYSAYGAITLEVVTDPDVRMMVQANGSIAYTAVGLNAPLTGFGGSTVTGNSTVSLAASSAATTNTLAVKIIDIAPGPDNAAGDAYTDVIVIWNQNVHAFKNILGA